MKPTRHEKPIQQPKAVPWGNPDKAMAINAVIIGLDQAFRESEATWGAGRLVCLVTDETRMAFRRGMDAYRAALLEGKLDALQIIAPKMRAALIFMSREADGLGHAPLAPNVWETTLADGRVLAIVRSNAEAHQVVREGRAMEVWTMEEIARVLPRMVSDIKAAFPGATVEKLTTHSEGFGEQWATAPQWMEEMGA